MYLLPTRLARCLKTADSKCVPWSVDIVFEEPNRDIYRVQNAVAIAPAVIFERGTASGHRENRSIIVRQYR